MKHYTISYLSESNEDVTEILSEDQIIESYWNYWSKKMIEKFGENHPEITRENCINDWIVVHWATPVHYTNTDNPIDFPSTASMMSDKGYELSTHEKQAEFARKRCGCHTCYPISYSDPDSIYMRLCPTCGNKRCPKATNHIHSCTNSNEPNQSGSIY